MDPKDSNNQVAFNGTPDGRLQLANLKFTDFYPTQRFRVTIEPLQPGICG